MPEGWTPPDPAAIAAAAEAEKAAKLAAKQEKEGAMSAEERSLEEDRKKSLEEAAHSMKVLSKITRALKAMGANIENVTEEDAMKLLAG